jgi:AraC family transcriptional regulator
MKETDQESGSHGFRVRGLILDIASYAPYQKVPKHAHENAFFCMALRGVCTEVYGRRVRRFEPSVMSFLPADHSHSLNFYKPGMSSFSIEIEPVLMNLVREYSLKVDDSLHFETGQLTLLLKRAYSEFRQRDAATPLTIEGLVLEMLAEVSRQQTNCETKQSPQWLTQVREFVHEHFSEGLTTNEISQVVGIHPVHLARVFRHHYRMTIGDYIRRLRVEDAARQIRSSRLPLLEIGLAAGFSDQSHFCRIFKRYIGATPSAYRSEHSKS